MPGGDGSGPRGKGPLTGRGLGFCSGSEVPGFWNGTRRPGLACRRGWGASRGGFFPGSRPGPGAGIQADDERRMLSARADMLREALEGIEARLRSLEGGDGDPKQS